MYPTCLDENIDKTTNICEIKITIEKDMPQPVYFYYELGNFYQNQRDYVRSRDYKQ